MTRQAEIAARVAAAKAALDFRDGNPNAIDSIATTGKRIAAAIRNLIDRGE